MKTKINKKQIIIGIIISILSLIFISLTYSNYKNSINIAKIKKELLEAQKPSKIEIQKQELDNLEKKWQELEKSCQEKPKVEEKIREKRKEIIGKK